MSFAHAYMHACKCVCVYQFICMVCEVIQFMFLFALVAEGSA